MSKRFVEAICAAFTAGQAAERVAFFQELDKYFEAHQQDEIVSSSESIPYGKSFNQRPMPALEAEYRVPPKEKEEYVPSESISSSEEEASEPSESEEDSEPRPSRVVDDEDDFCIREDSSEPSQYSESAYPVKPVVVAKGKRARKPATRYEPPPPDANGDRKADKEGHDVGAGRASRALGREMISALRLYDPQDMRAFLNHHWTKSQTAEFLQAIGATWGKGVAADMIRLFLTHPDIELTKCRSYKTECAMCQSVRPCTFYNDELGGYIGSDCALQCTRMCELGACFAQLASELKANHTDRAWAQSAWEQIHACQDGVQTAHAAKGRNLTKGRDKAARVTKKRRQR